MALTRRTCTKPRDWRRTSPPLEASRGWTNTIWTLNFLFGLVCTVLFPTRAQAELGTAWAVDDGTKVARSDLQHALKQGNGIFEPATGRIQLFGARNETVAFQLILEGGEQPTARVSVRLEALGQLRNHIAAGKSDTWLGRSLDLFLEHYVEVSFRSHAIAWEPWTEAAPNVPVGFIPDALVPLPADRSFEVPRLQNQGVWVDVYIPKDTPAGLQQGNLEVSVGGGPCGLPRCSFEVELRVLDLVLPDVPTIKTMLWFSGSDDDRDSTHVRYFEDPWEARDQDVEELRTRHFQLARRHRVTLFLGTDKQPTSALEARLDGSLFSPERGYEGPGEGLGQDMYSIYTYGSRELTPALAQEWNTWLTRVAPGTEAFYYTKDEPTAQHYAEVNRLARQGKPIASFTTAAYTPELDVDIFTALPSAYRIEDKHVLDKQGRRYWIYNGVRPYSGSFLIDDSAVSPRVNPWIQYKYGIARWFYWESTYYKDFQGGRGHIDVWNTAANFSNADGDRLNGDGLLIYPGRDLLFPASDQHEFGPLPSIRLKNWRRGIQDVEYLQLARDRGQGAFVDQLLERMIRRALATDSLHSDEPVGWREDGEAWLSARRLVATVLTSGQAQAVPPELGVAEASIGRQIVRTAKRIKRQWWKGRRRIALLGAMALMLAGGSALLLARRLRKRRARLDLR